MPLRFALMSLMCLSLIAGDVPDSLRQGRWQEAEAALKPDSTEHRYFLALARFGLGKDDACRALLDQLLTESPRHGRALVLSGLLHFRQKQYGAALDDLRIANHLHNDHAGAYLGRGLVLTAMGQKEAGARMFRRARTMDAQLKDAQLPEGKLLFHAVHDALVGTNFLCACCTNYVRDGRHHEDKVQAELAERGRRQQRSADQMKVIHDFQFRDRLVESGIRFLHTAVDDAGIHYKPVHYDHGNGIAVADVDGDGLLDVYYVTQVGPNQLYRNLGKGRFENFTDKAGVALAEHISVAASFADIDNDGDPDLYVTSVRMGNTLFLNDGKGHFSDQTKAAGLAYSGHSSGAVFFDYDNDGLLDLFLTNVGTYTIDERGFAGYYVGMKDAFSGHLKPKRFERSILYRNQGNARFEDVTEKANLVDTSFSGDAAFHDVDGDGYQDLYLLNMQGDDHFYRNVKGRFVDDSKKTFPKTPWGSMGVKFFDYDNDGLADLYITDMHSDMSQHIFPHKEKLKADMQWPDDFLEGGKDNIFGNALFWNTGAGFEEISDAMGAENYWPWGLSAADLNADGYEDLFVASSMNHPFRYGIDTVLLNHRGERFVDSEFILGIEPRPVTAKPWYELDCSGPEADPVLCGERKGMQSVWAAYGTRSSVIFDHDGDGDLDILTNEFNSMPRVLASNLAEDHELHYLQVALQGSKSNRDGLGARVTVVAGDKRFTRFNDGKSGYISQSSMPLYIGLGEATSVDKIEVLWPSGTQQTVTDVGAIGRTLLIREP